jgi:hypothetical protein
VFGFEGDGFEDEEVEGALDEIGGLGHTMIIYNGDCRLSRYRWWGGERREILGQDAGLGAWAP